MAPSLDEVMEYQPLVLPGEAVSSVHVRASTGTHTHNKRNMVNRRRSVRDLRRQRATRFIFGGVPLRSRGVRFELSPKRARARGPSRVRVSCGRTTSQVFCKLSASRSHFRRVELFSERVRFWRRTRIPISAQRTHLGFSAPERRAGLVSGAPRAQAPSPPHSSTCVTMVVSRRTQRARWTAMFVLVVFLYSKVVEN